MQLIRSAGVRQITKSKTLAINAVMCNLSASPPHNKVCGTMVGKGKGKLNSDEYELETGNFFLEELRLHGFSALSAFPVKTYLLLLLLPI